MDASRTSPIPPHPAPSAPDNRGVFGWVPTSAAWWGGIGFLRFHVSLFLVAIPTLFLINLVQSPERIWIDRVGLAWLALLVVHAAIAGIVWAIGLLRDDAAGTVAGGSTSQPRSTWITGPPGEPQDADFRVSGPGARMDGWGAHPDTREPASATADPAATAPEASDHAAHAAPAGHGLWDGWTAARPAAPSRLGTSPTASAAAHGNAGTGVQSGEEAAFAPLPDTASEERVSWRKVAEAAWLAPPTDDDPDPTPDDPAPERHP